MKSIQLLPVVATLLLAQPATAQTKRFVDKAATGAHTGTSWLDAYNDLQVAINTAVPGDTLFVAKGTYVPTMIAGTGTDRDNTFLLKDRVSIFGGFEGTEAELSERDEDLVLTTNATTLSGNIGTPDSSDNCYHVLTAINVSAKTTINGLIISDGNANVATSNIIGTTSVPRNFGGGFYNENSGMSLENLLIEKNYGLTGGGGIYNHNSPVSISLSDISSNIIEGIDPGTGGGGAILNINSNATLSYVVFSTNGVRQAQGGGAIRNENSSITIDNAYFTNNFAVDGDGGGAVYNADGSNGSFSNVYFDNNLTVNQAGGMYNDNSSPILSNVEFFGNSGAAGTGAMENDGGSNAVLTDVYFYENTTPINGGAMQNWKSSPILTNVEFTDNSAGEDGGAIYNYNTCSPSLTNCVFYNNIAGNNGAGFYNMRASNPILTNCILVRNVAGNDGGGIYTMAKDGSGIEPSSPILTNVTIANNIAGNSGGGGYADAFGNPRLRNSIISGNTANVVAEIDAPPAIAATSVFSSIIADQYFATGLSTPVTLTTDIFVDTLTDDFRLASLSGAIDMGDSNYYSPSAIPDLSGITADIMGADRIMGDNIDLGVFEVCSDTIKGNVTISVSPGTIVKPGLPATFTATVTNGGMTPMFMWRKNGVEIPGVYTAVYTAVSGTDFISGDKITVTLYPDLFGACESSDTVRTAPITMFIPAGISSVDYSNGISIYPNPNNGSFTLQTEFNNGKAYTLTIVDLTGRTLYTEKCDGTANTKNINVGNKIPSGTYMLSIENPDMPKQVKRFVIQ